MKMQHVYDGIEAHIRAASAFHMQCLGRGIEAYSKMLHS